MVNRYITAQHLQLLCVIADEAIAPNGQQPVNILILLHGLGDSHVPFERLGAQLNLPNTACIAIRAPNTLPFEATSFHWGDDVMFDSSTNGLDPDGGFKTSTPFLAKDVISSGLIKTCGYAYRDIVVFGLGQGGMAALNVASRCLRTEVTDFLLIYLFYSRSAGRVGRHYQYWWTTP